MNTESVQSFLAIVRYGSLSEAAEHLHVSQPALGKRLGQLEEEVGHKLIERSKGIRQGKLTEAGEAFIPHAERFIAEAEQMVRIGTAPARAPKETLNIASSDGPHIYVMNEANVRFKEKHPDTYLRLHTYTYKECYRRVASGRLDAAIVGANFYFQDVVSRPLYSEKMVFVCRSDSDYPEKVDARSLDLSACIYSPYSSDFINWFDHWFRLTGSPFIECDLVQQVENLLYSLGKNAWSIVPATVADAFLDKGKDAGSAKAKAIKLERRKLKSAPPDRTMYLVTGAGQSTDLLDSYISELTSLIKKKKSVKNLL